MSHCIVKDLENAPSQQPLRCSEGLNPPIVQPPESELRCSKCLKHQVNLLITKDSDTKIHLSMTSIVSKIIDPPSVEAARKQKDWLELEMLIKAELEIHRKLRTGIMITPPLNVNIVGSQTMLHYKLDKDGSISTCKSRLVAQGFTQQKGIDYNDTISPLAKLTAIRVIAAIAVRNDWKLEQMDVDAAYLNASFKEDIYMHQPKGFEAPSEEDKVIHLKRAIYGLRQSGREWYEDLMGTLTKAGFK